MNPLSGQLTRIERAHPAPEKGKPVDVEFAALLAFCKLGKPYFPCRKYEGICDSLKKLAEDHGMPDEIFNNSVAYADTVSAVIMAWSKGDHYLQTRGASEYTVMDSPGQMGSYSTCLFTSCRTALEGNQTHGAGQFQHVSCATTL